MRKARRALPALSALAALAILAVPPAASAATGRDGSSPVIGHVYVNDNTAGQNTIAAFDRHANGTLTAEAGSPFPAGGAGTGTGLASEGALQISASGHYLLAVDAGSNQVSVLKIRHGGSLTLVPGGVVASGGQFPVSIAVSGHLVYVANAAASGPSLAGFHLGHGRLVPIAGSAVPLPPGSQPGDVLFNGTGTRLVTTLVASSQIDSFVVGRHGLLDQAPGSPFAAQGLGPFGSEFSPAAPDQLFVSNAHNGGTGTGTVSVFSDAADGTLAPVGSSPFADLQTAPCWVEISHDGKFLFAVNTGSGEISSFSIAPGGTLTLLGSTPVSQSGGVGAVDARLSPDGGTLYIDESRAGAVGAFTVQGGSLTEQPGSPVALPAGATPAGIVVT